jgi:8-oxo-dGTP pyrophosphatase MutT (NUDIX family)
LAADPQRRQIAVGLIAAEDGRVLLQLRDDKPGLTGAGKWGFFGGHLESGESPEEAFLREMHEELGWRPRHFERYGTADLDSDGWHVISHGFAAHLDVRLDALTLGEGQAMQLFAPDALPEGTAPSVQPVIAAFAVSDAYRRVRKHWDAITATALIVDGGGRFLLQHRDDKPEIANPGLWGSFGGAIEPYETPHDGLLRELQEELSWQPDAMNLYGAYPFAAGMQLIYVYSMAIAARLDALVLGEGQGVDFFAPDALPAETVPDLRRLIEAFVRDPRYRAMSAAR